MAQLISQKPHILQGFAVVVHSGAVRCTVVRCGSIWHGTLLMTVLIIALLWLCYNCQLFDDCSQFGYVGASKAD
ncbi:hypothetical protein ACLKA6_013554 [Drosophila palustris]